MDIAAEEIGHVDMLATMVVRLLEGAPAQATAEAVGEDPVLATVIGGMDPRGRPSRWGGARYVMASGQPAGRLPRERDSRGAEPVAERAPVHDESRDWRPDTAFMLFGDIGTPLASV